MVADVCEFIQLLQEQKKQKFLYDDPSDLHDLGQPAGAPSVLLRSGLQSPQNFLSPTDIHARGLNP